MNPVSLVRALFGPDPSVDPIVVDLRQEGSILVETFQSPSRGEAPAFTAVMRYPEAVERDAAQLRRRIQLTRRTSAAPMARWPEEISVDVFSPHRGWVPDVRGPAPRQSA